MLPLLTTLLLIGYEAGGSAALTGHDNTSVGMRAGYSTTSGNKNVAVGRQAFNDLTTGANGTAVGFESLANATTGNNNTAFGHHSGYSITTAAHNTFIGAGTGYTSTGSGNTFIGSYGSAGGAGSGFYMTTGNDNTIVGAFTGNQSGLDIRTSDGNIVLSDGDGVPRGYYLSANGWFFKRSKYRKCILQVVHTTSGSPYGLNIDFTSAAPNNTTQAFLLVCQDSSTFRLEIKSNGNVVNANNSYGAISDQKLKENIVDCGSQWDDIKALTVRKYSMKVDNLDAPNRLGVIAQEVEEAGMGGLVFESTDRDKDTNEELETTTKSVNYSILYMKAVRHCKKQRPKLRTLETKVAALEAE